MKETKIWRVNLCDETYSGERSTFLISGKSAAVVEAKAILKAKEADADLSRGEAKHKPYVTSMELIGDLRD